MTGIRLLALDLDGTVLDSQWNLSTANHQALRQAYEHGVQIAFVTGRRYHTTHPVASALDFPHYLITTAGAVTRSSSGDRLFLHTIAPALLTDFLRHISSYRHCTFLITDANEREELWCENPCITNQHVARYAERNRSCLSELPDLLSRVPSSVIEAVLLGHVAEMREAVAWIDRFPERHRLKVLRTEYIDRDLCLLDVVDGATDKGQAVRRLAESLGIPQASIMAMGDNHSDLDMLAYAGFPVVMGNAPEELKSVGWPVTATNDDDGVARAIERFILADPSQTPMR